MPTFKTRLSKIAKSNGGVILANDYDSSVRNLEKKTIERNNIKLVFREKGSSKEDSIKFEMLGLMGFEFKFKISFEYDDDESVLDVVYKCEMKAVAMDEIPKLVRKMIKKQVKEGLHKQEKGYTRLIVPILREILTDLENS